MRLRLALLLAALTALAVALPSPAGAASLIAPVRACPAQAALGAGAAVQEEAMLCMVNFARLRSGAEPLEATEPLAESAREKAADILACDSFSHEACGRDFAYWIRANGYLAAPCWRAGENLAWGNGPEGGVRSIFRAWMRSPEHRENVLGDYTQTGIDLRTGELDGIGGTRVWTQHFGSHC
jgi:uncharacterized protein YkwD